ncbi:MAG: undecaprenyl-diphosphate phosphatase, partial [Lentisphaerae bacterium]|nr:undecaprenyl-diphosphate phosphatase [Lentisphaerota bacterium]
LLAGGILLKAKAIMSLTDSTVESLGLLLACLTATIVGILALKVLSWCQVLGKFWYFGVYCLVLGLTAVAFLIC